MPFLIGFECELTSKFVDIIFKSISMEHFASLSLLNCLKTMTLSYDLTIHRKNRVE